MRLLYLTLFLFNLLVSGVHAASAINGEVIVAVGTSGTNAVPSSRTTNSTILVQSNAGDGTNAFQINAGIYHTTGSLFEIQNNSTNKLTLNFNGELNLGVTDEGYGSQQENPGLHITQVRSRDGATFADLSIQSGFKSEDILDNGGVAALDIALSGATSDGGDDSYVYMEAFAYDGSGNRNGLVWNFDGTGSFIDQTIKVANVDRVVFSPAASDGTRAYEFDTSVAHAVGDLFEVQNNNTNVLTVDYLGVTTAKAGFSSTAIDTAVTIASGGWTNIFAKNATVYIDGTGLTFTVYNNAGTPVYTNAASVAHATVNLQPSGKVLITAGSGITGRATPF